MRKTLTCLVLTGFLVVAAFAAAQPGENRVALVIGNAQYPGAPLANPVNDAQDIAKVLKECGFDVTLRTDCAKAQMDDAIRELGRKARGGDVVLFFFAGHGFQSSDNKNYLMPVDAVWDGENEAKMRCYEAELVMAILDDAQARMNLIILDCCRDNPFTRSFRSSNIGLAAMTPPTDSVLVFSAAPGQKALDGRGRNSPFAGSMLKHVPTPGVELEELLMRISADVKTNALPSKQEPWRQTNRTSPFYFVPDATDLFAPSSMAALPTGPSAPPAPVSLTGHLQVNVNAPAARVRVDGEPRGMAAPEKPLNIEGLLAGQVQVQVDADGYEPMERVVEIQVNAWTQEPFVLSRVMASPLQTPRFSAVGHLQVTVNTPAAQVLVDGDPKGMASLEKPLTVEGLLAGEVKVRVSADGYEPLEKVVDIKANDWVQEPFLLSRIIATPAEMPRLPAIGHMQVSVNASAAQVLVDGEARGTASSENPLILEGLPAGQVTVRVDAEGFEPLEKRVDIKENDWTYEPFMLSKVIVIQPEAPRPPRVLTGLSKSVEVRLYAGHEMVYIQPGVFRRGARMSPDEVIAKYGGSEQCKQYHEREHPQHEVTLTQGFWMGIHEVTCEQYEIFVHATGHLTDAEKDGMGYTYNLNLGAWENTRGASWRNPGWKPAQDEPVVMVSWNDAQAYIAWLNEQGEGIFRLPTEAEWEYACRAGSETAFFWGDDIAGGEGYLNAADETKLPNGTRWNFRFPFYDEYWRTAPVKQFGANSWGLYDMLGNVWEWCEDWYAEYDSGAQTDPQGPSVGESRILRGGSWHYEPRFCRSAFRNAFAPSHCNDYLGFRIVRNP